MSRAEVNLKSISPALLREASLYRYPSAAERLRDGENPVDENNHALAALRYLVAGVDVFYVDTNNTTVSLYSERRAGLAQTRGAIRRT